LYRFSSDWVIDRIRQSERELPMSRVFEETSAILVLLVATVWRSVSENFPHHLSVLS
jgi:hypothetical protein